MPEVEKVYIEPGRRTGRTLQNAPKFLAAIAEGKRAFTRLNGVWFEVTTQDSAPTIPIYTALAVKPTDVQGAP